MSVIETNESLSIAIPSTSPLRLPKPERGDRLELSTDSFAFEGKAVARREDGYVVFVEGALAHERIVVEIKKAKSSYAEAKLVEILQAGPDRREPICPYFGICGGCALQHLSYEAQLYWKKRHVIDLFERVGKIPSPPVGDVIPSQAEYYYRNKMEFSFSEERWLTEEEIASGDVQDRFALGLHVRERFDRVIDTEVCFLPKPIVTDILNFTRAFARRNELRVFGTRAETKDEEQGLLRFLVVKTSHATKEIMVNLVTSREAPDTMIQYANELTTEIPGITTIINNINLRRSQVAVGDYEIVYHGEGTIRDRIGNAEYQISSNSFFQSNTPQAERLYEIATDFAELHATDHLWDLYCGTGTISLFVADKVKSVLGIELVEAAIADARTNAERNKITNAEFITSDLRKALIAPDFLANHPKPDVMIIDPPRNGMHADVIREILTLAPDRISYISCNPATQARDIALLLESYDLLELQPVDMFPQTYHIECVAKLRKKV
ncbi:MAG TPA: 23S rRNA (uracil(1939)-C(5))-methyltransferase RlmD [Candidatus Kapabacteria bacterium]|jgi:23S rRNA (uracil1939-C5)-methyltransferase